MHIYIYIYIRICYPFVRWSGPGSSRLGSPHLPRSYTSKGI